MNSDTMLVCLVALGILFFFGDKISINHRWRNAFGYLIFFGIGALLLALIVSALMMPGEFKGGVLVKLDHQTIVEKSDICKLRREITGEYMEKIIELRESIKPKCYLNDVK